MREVAAQLQADKAAAAEATKVARHDACALRQPDESPAVEVGSHLEVLVLIEHLKGVQPVGCSGGRRGG